MKAEELGTLVAVIPGESGTQDTLVAIDTRITEASDVRLTEDGDVRVIQ